jgi:hypothetical protein
LFISHIYLFDQFRGGDYPHGNTGIDHQIMPSGETSLITGQIQRAESDIIRRSCPVDRQNVIKVLGKPLGAELVFFG